MLLAHTTAALSRAKRMPSLKSLLGDKPAAKTETAPYTPDELAERRRAHEERVQRMGRGLAIVSSHGG